MNEVHIIIFLQIVLEMLPVSSSGNIALFERLYEQYGTRMQLKVSVHDYASLLHIVAAFLVCCYFFVPWLQYAKKFLSGDLSVWLFACMCICAELATTLCWLIFSYTGTAFFPLWFGFLITGCSLYTVGCTPPASVSSTLLEVITFKQAIIVGLAQGVALLPGISRFGSTFVVGRWMGLSGAQSFELSFLLALPLMLVGTVRGVWQLLPYFYSGQLLRLPFLFSILSATALGWYSLQWVGRLIAYNQLSIFAWWLWILAGIAYFY